MTKQKQGTTRMKARTSFERAVPGKGDTEVRTVARGEIIDATAEEVQRHYESRKDRPLLVPLSEEEAKADEEARASQQASEEGGAGDATEGDESRDLDQDEVLDYLSTRTPEEAEEFAAALDERIRSGDAAGFASLGARPGPAEVDADGVRDFLRDMDEGERTALLAEFAPAPESDGTASTADASEPTAAAAKASGSGGSTAKKSTGKASGGK